MNKKLKIQSPLFCDYCGRSFQWKVLLKKHISLHIAQEKLPRIEGLTCEKCNLVFKNKGLLSCHNSIVHNERTEKKNILKKNKHICQVCQEFFFYVKDLKLHIRECHFNLLSHIPYFQVKKVNQVWFEKVMNSENIVEIKKVADNMLLMRKLDDNTAMKVSEHSTEVIDLHNLYPTKHHKNHVQCKYCARSYDKCYINKHEMDVHLKYNDKELIKK